MCRLYSKEEPIKVTKGIGKTMCWWGHEGMVWVCVLFQDKVFILSPPTLLFLKLPLDIIYNVGKGYGLGKGWRLGKG